MSLPPSFYVTPGQHRGLRACMVCSIVMPQSSFMKFGCPNCEGFLELAGSSEAIQDCTSQVFEGVILLTDPEKSWVAKYQRLEGCVPGSYATKVVGILPEEYIATVERAGVRYIPRDGSAAGGEEGAGED